MRSNIVHIKVNSGHWAALLSQRTEKAAESRAKNVAQAIKEVASSIYAEKGHRQQFMCKAEKLSRQQAAYHAHFHDPKNTAAQDEFWKGLHEGQEKDAVAFRKTLETFGARIVDKEGRTQEKHDALVREVYDYFMGLVAPKPRQGKSDDEKINSAIARAVTTICNDAARLTPSQRIALREALFAAQSADTASVSTDAGEEVAA